MIIWGKMVTNAESVSATTAIVAIWVTYCEYVRPVVMANPVIRPLYHHQAVYAMLVAFAFTPATRRLQPLPKVSKVVSRLRNASRISQSASII